MSDGKLGPKLASCLTFRSVGHWEDDIATVGDAEARLTRMESKMNSPELSMITEEKNMLVTLVLEMFEAMLRGRTPH